MLVTPKPGKWSTPTTTSLPAAAGTPQNCGSTVGKTTIYVRSTQSFKWVFAVDASAAAAAFLVTGHGRIDAGTWPISVNEQDAAAGLSLFVERESGTAVSNGLSYWSED